MKTSNTETVKVLIIINLVISEENILRTFKTYYKQIIKFNPDVFVKWINNLIIRKNIQSEDSTESDVIEFRKITQKYLKSGEINILNVIYFLDYLMGFIEKLYSKKKLGKDSSYIIILGIINYIIDPYLTNNIGLFYYIYEKFFENLNEKNAQSFIDFDKKFNEILEEKVNNSIITYLKIRNDNHTSKTFNKGRFPSISHDQQLNIIQMTNITMKQQILKVLLIKNLLKNICLVNLLKFFYQKQQTKK